jgi:lysozyme family protein
MVANRMTWYRALHTFEHVRWESIDQQTVPWDQIGILEIAQMALNLTRDSHADNPIGNDHRITKTESNDL